MKKFIAGLIIGAGLMFSLSASAEVVNYVGKAIEGQFPVKVDGKTITSPGIVIDGTSYLPTRTIAELAGYDVSFNADMGVELKRKQAATPAPTPEQPVVIEEPKVDPAVLIKGIESRIEKLQQTIELSERYVINNPNASEDQKRVEQEAVDRLRAQIAELEAEKAELEAQLAETP